MRGRVRCHGDEVIRFETDKSKRELEKEVDGLLDEFEQWFIQQIDNSKLTGPERSIVKTFLYYVLVTKKQSPGGDVSAGSSD